MQRITVEYPGKHARTYTLRSVVETRYFVAGFEPYTGKWSVFDKAHILARRDVPSSPFVRRALAGELPAKALR